MTRYNALVDGYKTFKLTALDRSKDIIRHQYQLGIKPSTLFITSCDLPISPDQLTSARPGELYVMRNIGGLVPPFEKEGVHGSIAAIEYAVTELHVENIIVLNHAHCTGIKELMVHEIGKGAKSDPMETWLSIAMEAKQAVLRDLPDADLDEKVAACAEETVLISTRNLLGYPWVKQKVEKNELSVFAWFLDVTTGELLTFNPQTRNFEPVI